MNRSDTIANIAPALLEAQKEIGAAKKGAENPFFHSKYADLGAVMEACKEALNRNNITVLQPVMGDCVETVLIHSSGEWISSETPIVQKLTRTTNRDGDVVETISDPQAVGSAISYARRYGLQSMVFIPSEDDDANNVSQGNTVDRQVTRPIVHANEKAIACDVCGLPATERRGTTKGGKAYHGVFCSSEDKSHTKWLWN